MEATKFYIRHLESYPETVLQDYSRRGFAECGIEVAPFYWIDDIDGLADLSPTVGVAGYIGDVHRALKVLGKPIPPNVDYPEALREFLGRKIRCGLLSEVRASVCPVFVKPVAHKEFTGFVWDASDVSSRRRAVTQADDVEVWISDVVDFRAEYRSFILEDRVLDCRIYKGDWSKAPARDVVEAAVKAMRGIAPVAYSLDWGVAEDGRTLLVEMNEGYSLGHYGLHPALYARMLDARWHQMTRAVP